MMNNRGKSAQSAQRCQTQPKAQQQGASSSQKKKRSSSSSSTPSKTIHCGPSSKISVTADAQVVKSGGIKVALDATTAATTTTEMECPKNHCAQQRKLSDDSVNTSDSDLSRDSGCADLSRDSGSCSSPSPKSVSSDSGSDVSDCPPTDTKLLQDSLLLRDNDTETTDSSWTDGRAYSPDRSPLGGGKGGDDDTGPTGTTRQHCRDGGFLGFGGGGFLGVLGTSSGTYLDSAANAAGGLVMMMDETTEDLVREVEDLRSENEYLKDEVEELRCEVVEMRDMFHQEEVEQLQALQLQVERANKTCRILQYRLRKAERRSIRVAQTGHVDGELVRSLEHDIKVAKCVSVRVHNELESVQMKKSKLEEENEALREKMEELAVSKMVLQAEMDKTRESSLKRRGVRSPNSKAERRLSQHMEDDSADLKCQLHFAKEELALMCKKLTRLVSESEGMREELARYRSAYGDVAHAHAPGGGEGRAASSALAREAEVKVHLRLVEEEATLLSRRIVELEVENRGLRAEVSDERERVGGGGGGEDEEVEGAAVDDLSPFAQRRETEDRGHGVKTLQREEEEQRVEEEEGSLQRQSEEETLAMCQITREGPVGGERDPADSRDSDVADKQESRGLRGMTANDYETLLALRGHSCIVSSAIHVLLTSTSSRNNHHLCSSDALSSAKEVGGKAESAGFLHGPLKDTLELLQAMLLDFSGRVEKLLTAGGMSLQKDGHALDILSPACGGHGVRGEADTGKAVSAEDLRTAEVKERVQQQSEWSLVHSHRAEPRMGLTFQILWVLHQWCEMKASGVEGKENIDKTMCVLRSLLEELGADMINDAKLPQSTMTECAVVNTIIFDEGKHSEADRCFNSKGKRRRRLYAPYGSNLWEKKKNWVYVSQEAAQADREVRVRTWDHPIMALNFPELDFEQIQEDRSHTAPETTAVRVYYSPPSARRVHTAHLHNKLRNISPAPSVTSASASWCTPPSSLSALCLGLSSNLSDDMKEITAGFSPGLRQPVHSASLERRRARGLDVSCSATQTHMMQPQMVSVGLQTDVSQRRSSPARGPLLSARSTSSLERLAKPSSTSSSTSSLERQAAGRTERPKPSSSSTSTSTSSPKLYRRHSASSSSTYFSTSLLASSPVPVSTAVAASRERGSWSNGVTPSWTSSTANNRSGLGGGGGHNNGGTPKSDGGNSTGGSRTDATKPPSKAAAATGGRYGLVTEFLRRVSGRAADKPPGGPTAAGLKSSGLKHLERAPSRAPPGGQAATLHHNDSVTRIVNQRFMKQKEREDRANGQHQSNTATRGTVTRNHSSASVAAEGGSDESSSSRTLSFCFARPSRGTQRQQASPQCKPPQRHRVATSLTGTNDSCSDVEN